MAKYKVEFENREIKHTLTFREQEFDYTMKESEIGMESDNFSFSKQLIDTFSDLDENKLCDEIDVDMLDCYLDESGNDDLFELLERLGELE